MVRKSIYIGIVLGILLLPVTSFAYTVNFDLNQGTSYQDEGTLTYNDTVKLKDLDNNWGPTTTGTVVNSYYATGTATQWFDAISANFDLSGVNLAQIKTVTLMAYIKTGGYSNHGWHHYELYQGAFNAADQDSNPLGHSFDYAKYSNGGWISHEVPLAWVTSNNLDLSLRLWNASVDQVKLQAEVVPEPMSVSLLGLGLLGAVGAFRRKK